MKLNQTKSNGSVRLCSTCSIIILMKKTVFDFIQLLKYDIKREDITKQVSVKYSEENSVFGEVSY